MGLEALTRCFVECRELATFYFWELVGQAILSASGASQFWFLANLPWALEKGNSVIMRVNWRYAKLAKRLSARWQRRQHKQISNPSHIRKGRIQYPKGVDLCFRSKPAITRWISSSLPIPHNWKMSIYVITCGRVCHYICQLTQICQQKFQPILLGCSSSQNPCCEIFAYSEQEGFCNNNNNQQDENDYVDNNQFPF